MSSFQAYVGTVLTPGAGAGSQVVTGIVDKDGHAFIPKVVLFFAVGGGTFTNFEYVISGVDDGTNCWGYVSAADYYARVGTSYRSNYSTNHDSIVYSGVGFGVPPLYRAGKITAKASGQFTITYTADAFAGEKYFFVALGGDDLTYKIGTFDPIINPTPVEVDTGLGTQVTVLFVWHGGEFFPNITTSFGSPCSGWASSAVNQECSAITDVGYQNPSVNARYQPTDRIAAHFDDTVATSIVGDVVLQLVSTDGKFTVQSSLSDPDTTSKWQYLALSGISAYAGSAVQRSSIGVQVLSTPGVDPICCFFMGVDGPPSGAVVPGVRLSRGASDGTNNVSCWSGNDDNINPDNPTRYSNSTSSYTAATPPSTITAQISGATFASQQVRATFATADSSGNQLLYLALGPASGPPPISTDTGLYQLVLGKTNDTIYTGFSPVTTENVKIP